jgi:hypothetical protein
MSVTKLEKLKYYIGKLGFKTKKECETYTRNIINSLGICKINKEHTYFSFFDDLLKNHPSYDDKKGIGIDYFYIEPNPFVKKYYQMMIKRLDGSEIDFSWVYCCQFKERTTRDYLLRSMREAIKNDTIQYKQKQSKLICNFCKTENELYENYHVDHHNPSFQIIKDNFLLTKNQIPLSFGECKIYNVPIFKDEDKDFKNEWLDYHTKNCNFQILCRDCNLRKTK